ncbi:hypothetical protein ANCCAN_23482 [Ancylostoma caninum]|uniref:MADF domain-containing protein n=1 Tax=Ancylostoma caninum TaxID=29170 RepID=A0A368FEZ3_ANCCA|nr:hypothetical protein ANCCAN_23482 [Ancylostoma caninum]
MSLTVRYHWTSPLREALAKSVEKREKLWKKFPVVSHDVDLRAKLWAEVAEELMEQFDVLIDTEDMKKTWKNLKDNYWRIIKAFDTEPERAMRWKFYEAMRFMERANTDEPPSRRSHGFDPHNVPSSSSCKPQHPRTAEELLDETDIKNSYVQSPSQATLREMPLQLKGMSGNGRKRIRRRGPNKPPDFVQISIPELDRLISTKQRPPFGTQIQSMPVDLTEDNLTFEMEPVWKQLEEEAKAKLKAERALRAALNSQKQAAEWARRISQEDENTEGKLGVAADDNKFSDLIKIAQLNYKLDEEAQAMIMKKTTRLRGIYHQGAFALFVKQGMPQGKLQKLLDAFDDFVYNKKPKDPIILEVVETCDPSVHDAFLALFSIVERYAGELNLRYNVPESDNRWARMDKESKIEVNTKEHKRAQHKRKAKYDLAEPDAAEHQPIVNRIAHDILTKKIKEYTATMTSTQDLLSTVDYNDHQTRRNLVEKLKRTQDVIEKITKEQRELDVQYREFQCKQSAKISKPQKRRMVSDTARDSEEVTTPIAATDLLESKEATSIVTELFDNTVKNEPQ